MVTTQSPLPTEVIVPLLETEQTPEEFVEKFTEAPGGVVT
jgi:hypothetical protein